MNYVIAAPPYLSTSAGVHGLHLLKDHLIEAGQTCRIVVLEDVNGTVTVGPEVIYPTDDEIVIYPDCFKGNPLKAKNVVRYLMMYLGYFGLHTTTEMVPNEYPYYYSQDFSNGHMPENVLSIPMIDEARFPYKPEGREGTCYLAIKYHDYFQFPVTNLPDNCERITKLTDLSSLFSSKKKLITFDNSAINIEAALAGMEVECRYNEKFKKLFDFGPYWDSRDLRASYLEQKRLYYTEQLPNFIERTQRYFG